MHQVQLLSHNHTAHNLAVTPGHTQQQLRKKIQNYSFSLSDRIGKGYTSIVYKGRNDITLQTVAIKVIDLKFINDEIKKNLLQNQLECMKKNLHNNILRYIDSYQTVNNCYIVTEYCQGGDLEKYLRVRGRLSEQQVKAFWRQFYPAFHSLISAGYIHRDLKPANMFLKQNSLKIADFGMIKKMCQNPRDSYNVGTPVYMPPQSLISNIYSQKSDVWSIGVILYQLTHGTFPWRGADQRELKFNIQNSKVMYDYRLISVDLGTFINRCLEKNPNMRIGVKEMATNFWVSGVMAGSSTGVGIFGDNRNTTMVANYGNQKMQKNLSPVRSFTAPKSVSLNHISSIPILPLPSLQSIPSLQSVPSLQLIQHDTPSCLPPKSERPTMDSLPPNQTPIQMPKRKQSFTQQPTNHPQPLLHSSQPPTHEPSLHQRNPSGPLSHPTRPNKKSPLDYLISILNYLRYVYKVYKNVCETKTAFIANKTNNSQKSDRNWKDKVKDVLVRELLFGIQLQERMSIRKENVFGIQGWADFVNSRKWHTFVNVVQQYATKYRKLSKSPKTQQPPTNLLPTLTSTISTLFSNLHPQQNPQIHFQSLQLLDSLSTLHQLIKQINNKGWLPFIDQLTTTTTHNSSNKENDGIKNCYKSKEVFKDKQNCLFQQEEGRGINGNVHLNLNQIVEAKGGVHDGNWKFVWRRILNKMQDKF